MDPDMQFHAANGMSGYKGGRIVRIQVHNFMTYDNLEIFPKKGLNIIIGLNGSGKSSLMSAICLGLAGKPQFTGKSTLLSDFIKHGQQKAFIEIELEDPVENVVIRRVIEGDKSTYILNKSHAQHNEVVTTLKRYNIDVGNLCQFLPQEKVSDFSKIDQKLRLEVMMQAIGEPMLHELFSDLKQMKADSIAQEKELHNLENKKTHQVNEKDKLHREVVKHNERVKLLEELETLQVQKKAAEYQILRSDLKVLKKEIKDLKNQTKVMQNEVDKIHGELTSATSSMKEKITKIKETKGKSSRDCDQLFKFQKTLTELYAKTLSVKVEYQNRMDEKQSQKQQLVDLEKQILAMTNLIEQNAACKNVIQQNTDRNSKEYEDIKANITALDSEIESIKLLINQSDYQKNSEAAKIRKLKGDDSQMKNWQQKSSHTVEAVHWLEHYKNLFKSTIFLPPFLSVRVKKDEDRKFVENTISMRDLKTFICTDEDDLKRLVNALKKEKRLNVNIGLAPQEGIAYFKTPSITPKLKNLGVEGFVSDLFTAPEPVMCYLCALFKLHKIPVCNSTAYNNIQELLKEFQKFYTPDEKISGIYSRYGSRNLTIRKDGIVDKHLLQSSNSFCIREIEEKIEKVQRETEESRTQLRTYENQRHKLERDQETLRKEMNELKEKNKRITSLQIMLRQRKEQYKRKESEVINEGEVKKDLTRKMCAINYDRSKIISDINSLGLNYVQLKLQDAKLFMYAKRLSTEMANLKIKVQEKKSSFQSLERKLEAKTYESNKMKEKALELYEYIRTHKSPSLTELCIHAPLEKLQADIIQAQAKLELNYEENASILQAFQNQEKLVSETTKKIEQIEIELKSMRIEMEKKKQQWLPVLESHIKTVNQKFSQYYKLLNCAGEISLETGDDPDNFAQYGLQVKLKYRDNEPFSVLSPDHHSGGERNVASIIFILSLQELTTVPFRCVDEINQGMDSSNERKMYEFIANEAAKTDSCSQYFLLTPKLLKDLTYHRNVAVHVIFNSKYLSTKLNVKEHLKIGRGLMERD